MIFTDICIQGKYILACRPVGAAPRGRPADIQNLMNRQNWKEGAPTGGCPDGFVVAVNLLSMSLLLLDVLYCFTTITTE